MISDELRHAIMSVFTHQPTSDQQHAITCFCRFLTDRDAHAVMIMRGSAGTGKTTLAAAIVNSLKSLHQKLVLLAPTGRAAKVLSVYAHSPAFTIHRRIYRQRSAGDLSSFSLNDNVHSDTLFIVDESSMIQSTSSGETAFGNGSLLDDLLQYVYGGRNCRLLLIGDKAQLPPVGETESAALSLEVLASHGLTVHACDLDEVVRQDTSSGILYNATMIRRLIAHDAATQLPKIVVRGFADIAIVTGSELIEQLGSSYSRVGVDETIVVTRSNKRANIYNQGIRNSVIGSEEELCRGDQLMIVKNNYFWTQSDGRADESAKAMAFLANGDRCVVQRVRNIHEMHGFRFAEATLLFPDYDDYELLATVLLDTLRSESASLSREQQEHLFAQVMTDYDDTPLKSDRLKLLRQDKYYNALQIKFSYAVTCHKAQGGQWSHVYVDQGYMTDDMLTPDYIHWLYTAFTRATEKLYLVNWPRAQCQD